MIRALALALLVVTCGAPDPGPGDPASLLPDEAGPLDALNRRHGRLRQRMRVRGYDEQLGLSRTFVLEDRGVAWPLDLAVGRCSTFVALGGGSLRDLELTLFDGEGDEAATDSVENEGGLLHVCPQAEEGAGSRPYYLQIRALEGAGAVMVAHFGSDPTEGEGFDGLFEGVLAPRVPFRDVEEHLARSRAALRARGFAEVGEAVLERVSEGSVVRAPARLEAGRCYVAIGRSGEGVGDIDLFLLDQTGVEIARDLGADAEPSIEHCPEEDGRFRVELRAFEGAGAVGLLVMGGPRPESEEEPGATPTPTETSEDDDPSVALGVLAAPLTSRGFSPPLFASRDAAIVPGEVRTHDVVVGPGCALIAGTASDSSLDLDLYLADTQGREIDRDTAVQSTARVRACRDQATVLRVAVKGYGRDGTYALAVLRAPATVATLQQLRIEEVTAPYRARGYAERLQWRANLDTGERFRRALPLEPGSCVAVAAAGDDGAADVDVFLRDSSDELVASDTGPAPQAAVSRCAEGPGESLSLEAMMFRGRGSVSVYVLRSREERDEPEDAERATPAPREAPALPESESESEPEGASADESDVDEDVP